MTDQRLLGDRYEVNEVLGRGGMATVRSARDRTFGRDVAVKELRADLASDPTFQERFRREAQASGNLNHPNIVSVYDTGEAKDPTSGVSVPYIVMELVKGRTLRDILRDGRPILPRRALEFTVGVLDALAYSHAAGIVHRDIKPANVMITTAGNVKVMDFGIARAVSDTSSTMTQTAAVIGTAQYLSPEQARGETVDARSDLYSTGCLLYELLVGRPPFTGDSPVSVAYQHVREAPVPPSTLDPEVTPGMDAVVLRALAKSPEDRYQTASEMATDIRRLLAGQPVAAALPTAVTAAAVPVAAAAEGTSVLGAVSEQTGSQTVVLGEPQRANTPEPRRGRWLWPVLIGLLVLALAGSGAFFVLNQRKAQVTVPNVKTLEREAAILLLQEKNLNPTPKEVQGPNDATVGRVTDQVPAAGATVDPGSTVTIIVNVGPTMLQLPSSGIVGNDLDLVTAELTKAGFKVLPVTAETEPPTAVAKQILRVEPAEGSKVAAGQQIVLYYATGQAKVPAVGNYDKDVALKACKDLGLNAVLVGQPSPLPENTVIRTDPAPGTLMKKTDKLTIYYATPMPVQTPTQVPTTVAPTTPAPTTPSTTPSP